MLYVRHFCSLTGFYDDTPLSPDLAAYPENNFVETNSTNNLDTLATPMHDDCETIDHDSSLGIEPGVIENNAKSEPVASRYYLCGDYDLDNLRQYKLRCERFGWPITPAHM